MTTQAKAASSPPTQGRPGRSVRVWPALATSLLLAATVLALAAAPASAAKITHNFLFSFDGHETPAGTFGPPREGSPDGIAVDNSSSSSAGEVYVDDNQHRLLDKFSPSGTYLCQITGAGSATTSPSECDSSDPGLPGGSFNFSSGGIAVDASGGSLFGPDPSANLVDSFGPSGAYLSQFHLPDNPGGASPYAVAIAPSGDAYVSDIYPNAVLDRFDPETSSTTTFATGTPAGPFALVRGVAVDGDPSSPSFGDVYVAEDEQAESGRDAVDVFDSSGTFLRSIVGTPAGPFSSVFAITVDPINGHLYVDADQVIDEFDASGSFLTSIAPSATPSGSWFLDGVAISASSGRLYVADGRNNLVDVFTGDVTPPEIVTGQASAVTPTSATLNGTVNPVGVEVTDCHFEYGTDTSYGHSVPCAETVGSGSSPLPVHADLSGLQPGTTYHFRLAAANANGHEAAEDQVFGPPLFRRAAAEEITPTSATLHAVLDPDGVDTSYRFEYGTDTSYGHSVPVPDADAGSAAGDQPVGQALTGLSPETTYHFRLVATNSAGTLDGPDQTFPTLPAALLDPQPPTEVTATSATLHTYLDPLGVDTSYRFEYGTDTSYGHTTAAADAGSAAGPQLAGADLTGLQPGTTYHFRTLTISSFGTATGPDSTFTTLPASCPNQALREEDDSLALPECRAYERVSPADKAGYGAREPALSPSGERALFGSIGTFAGDPGARLGATYLAQRGPDGWSSVGVDPPPGLGQEQGLVAALWPSSDFTRFIKQLRFAPNAGAAVAAKSAALFMRGPDGTYAQASPAYGYLNGEALSFIETVAASADDSHVLITAIHSLLPGDTESHQERLYEVAGAGTPSPLLRLATVDENGAPFANCEGAVEFFDKALAADGSRVFFTMWAHGLSGGCEAEGGSEEADMQLLARVGGQTTINLSEPSPNDECTTLACITAPDSGAALKGISADGSRAFFLDARQLTDAASEDPDAAEDGAGRTGSLTSLSASGPRCQHPSVGPNGCNLYVYDFNRPAGHNLLALSAGDTSGLGPEVRNVLRVSRDGSHVYFVAGGVLTPRANSLGQLPQAGADNLYVADAETGAVSFIADLCSGTEESGTASDLNCPGSGDDNAGSDQAESDLTPDGRYLVFTTYAQITPDDTNQAADVYRYDAQTAGLVRISVGHRGEDQDGNGGGQDAFVVREASEQSEPSQLRAISDDGQTVLFYTDRPLQSSAENGLVDSYEWHQGEITLISGGRNTTVENPKVGTGATISASGRDIVFTSAQGLLPWDTDGLDDVYDARVDGGFPEPPPPPAACESPETCHGASPPVPPPPPLGTPGFVGPGNEPARLECGKGRRKAKKHGQVRCVAEKHHKAKKHHHTTKKHHKRAAKHNGGGSK